MRSRLPHPTGGTEAPDADPPSLGSAQTSWMSPGGDGSGGCGRADALSRVDRRHRGRTGRDSFDQRRHPPTPAVGPSRQRAPPRPIQSLLSALRHNMSRIAGDLRPRSVPCRPAPPRPVQCRLLCMVGGRSSWGMTPCFPIGDYILKRTLLRATTRCSALCLFRSLGTQWEQVMVSSMLDDLQDQHQLSLFAKISQHVACTKSHMLSISHSTAKTTYAHCSISEEKCTRRPVTNWLCGDPYLHPDSAAIDRCPHVCLSLARKASAVLGNEGLILSPSGDHFYYLPFSSYVTT